MPKIQLEIKIARADMKALLERWVAEPTQRTEETAQTMNDNYRMVEYSNPSFYGGYLSVSFHKYRRDYTYAFSFYNQPSIIFKTTCTQKIKLNGVHGTTF